MEIHYELGTAMPKANLSQKTQSTLIPLPVQAIILLVSFLQTKNMAQPLAGRLEIFDATVTGKYLQ